MIIFIYLISAYILQAYLIIYSSNSFYLLGWYIESFAEAKDDSVEAIALAEGVQAMLEAKGSKL